MNKLFALFTSLLMTTVPAYAETWLCIGEYGAAVSHNGDEVTGSDSFRATDKLIIDADGVKSFGNDDPFIGPCDLYRNRDEPSRSLIICDNKGKFSNDHLMKTEGNVFILSGSMVDDEGTVKHYVVKGKCSKIDTKESQ